jgi:DNA-directed RNA polymerase sigma subunit (sigma70/sigma32)
MRQKRSSQTLAIEERLKNHQSARSIARAFGLTQQRVKQIENRMQGDKILENRKLEDEHGV